MIVLKKIDFVATPENWQHIDAFIEGISKEERFAAQIAAAMAWNLACDYADQNRIEVEESDNA
jgi:hypothetical protein